ncbi:MAG: Holliday junction branch migration protein RuvA [Bacteroidota bacterium]|nr:Holliday junction branch migration protein RuvA [Bacteroidota bacterium]
MIAYIEGLLAEKTPTYVIIDNNGIGYKVNISLNTYTKINSYTSCKLLTYLSIKEDSHTLYGFAEESERRLFLNLISVSGVGNNTALLILSSLTTEEVAQAIVSENVKLLQGIKGIGSKTAQRLIVDLKDKLGKDITLREAAPNIGSTIRTEALSALTSLGFSKVSVEKTLDNIIRKGPSISTVEDLIKMALKNL